MRTQTVRCGDIRFFMNNKLIEHDSPHLSSAELVSITFRDQKNGNKMETINIHASNDPILCPVRAWCRVIQSQITDGIYSLDRYISSYKLKGKINEITDKVMTSALRSACSKLGVDKLGFSPSEICTHCIRAGGAMALHLAGKFFP